MISIPDESSGIVLTESRTMRDRTIARTDVLDKVKALALLPDNLHATTEIVADYYEVDVEAIKSLVRRNRDELGANGMATLRGAELVAFERVNVTLSNAKRRALSVFSRKAVLNVGQLLTESDVARRVRSYLLIVEEQATPQQRSSAVEKAAEAEAQLRAIEVLARIDGNTSYARSISRHIAARMLGEEPELDPLDVTITADEYLTEQGVCAADLPSARTRLGRTVAALYRARYSKDPQKVKRPVNGAHRDVAVYTHRDLDLFDTAWSEVGRHYAVQTRLDAA